MKHVLLAAVGTLALGGVAQAQTFNFDDQVNAAGTSLLNTTPTGFTVSGGTVDLVKSGEFSIDCAGGAGGCVDLDGSTGDAGIILSNDAFVSGAGELKQVSLDFSGNQRGGSSDTITGGLLFNPAVTLSDVLITLDGITLFSSATLPSATLSFGSLPVLADDPFKTIAVRFRSSADTAFRVQLGALGGDNIGPVIDNLSISAVPEPATWAMMIGGFGLVGGAMRRRAARTSVTYA